MLFNVHCLQRIIRHRHHVETATFVNIKSRNLDSHIFAIKEATFAKKVSLYSVSNYLIISASERCQNGRHVVEKAEKMQKKTEKLLFYWSVVFVTNKIKNKGELIGKQ